jgi:hypothetical protein
VFLFFSGAILGSWGGGIRLSFMTYYPIILWICQGVFVYASPLTSV